MNKIAKILSLTLLTISSLSFAQKQEEEVLLWKISGSEIAEPSYLYGTIHIICEKDIRIKAVEAKAFSQAKKIYLELDLDSPTLTNEIQAAALSKSHLKEHISAKGYHEIDDFFTQQLGYSMEAVGMVKPYYLLSYTYKPTIGCQNPVSIEQLLVNEAKEQNKEILGLETLEQQTEVYDKLNVRKQARLLLKQVRRSHLVRQNYADILDLYQNGRVESLNKKIINSPSRRLNRKLLKKRNQAWVKTLATVLPQQSNFVAVGAAHLGGRAGLIHQLRKEGYTVEAVK
ncbi:MAG: TraB/GumN family protein [Spirosomaceae bacterium]|nr:TraB/GumN family protein [Spirosomataceae bacterium]